MPRGYKCSSVEACLDQPCHDCGRSSGWGANATPKCCLTSRARWMRSTLRSGRTHWFLLNALRPVLQDRLLAQVEGVDRDELFVPIRRELGAKVGRQEACHVLRRPVGL